LRTFLQFIKAAGEWGWTSVIGTAILVAVSVLEHVRDHNLTAYVFVILAAALFCLGAFKAWDAERGKLEAFVQAAKKPQIEGTIVAGFIDAKKFLGFGSEQLQDLAEGSYVSFFVRAVNHSECPGHFMTPPRCQLEIYGTKYTGVFESCPEHFDLAVDDPSFREQRLMDFFQRIFASMPMQRGIPHSGWMRFYVQDFSYGMLLGKEEIPAVATIELDDTLGGHHLMTSENTGVLLRVGKIKLTSDVFKQQSRP